MRSRLKAATRACIGMLVLLLTGCASAPDIDDMTLAGQEVSSKSYPPAFRDNIFVSNVAGGEKTNPLWTSEINADGMKTALVESLRNANLYAPESNAGYQLLAVILDVQQPVMGFNLTVTTTIEYTLLHVGSGEEFFQEAVSADYTATVDQSWYGVERLKIANEGSVRENIRMLLERLSNLSLP